MPQHESDTEQFRRERERERERIERERLERERHVNIRLVELEGKMTEVALGEQWRELLVKGQAEIRDELRDLRATILGDGREPGLFTRLDRVEQVQTNRNWWMRMVSSAVVMLVLKAVWEFFAGKKP